MATSIPAPESVQPLARRPDASGIAPARTGGPGDVSVQGLGKRFGSKWVVDDLSFVVPSGSFLSIVGPSGCGKSTTLRLIAGLDRPDSGEIHIGSRLVSSQRAGAAVPSEQRNIGFVFQSYALWPHMTVFEHVMYPLAGRRQPRAELHDQVEATLRIVGLADLRPRYPSELSGGQQQRVALARALVQEPALLLLDEPLSNLDAALRARMGSELRKLQQELKLTAIYVTHDRVEALSLSDQVMVMHDGKAIEHGTPLEVYEQPRDLFSAHFVSGANTLRGTVAVVDGTILGIRLAETDATLRVPCRTRGTMVSLGSEVWVAARPETIAVAGPAAGGDVNIIEGVVESVTYFGAYSDVLALVGSTLITARVEPHQALRVKVGEPVRLALPVDSLVALPA